MGIKDLFKNAQHSTKMGQERQEAYAKEQDATETVIFAGLQKTHETWNRMYTQNEVPKTEKLLNYTLGASRYNNVKQNLGAIGKTTIRAGAAFLTNDVIETHARMENYTDMAGYAGIGAVIDFTSSYLSVNDAKIRSVFADVVSKKDADVVDGRIRFEKVLYATEHAAAGVILPALTKFGVDKMFKCKDNKLIDGILSFGTFSTVGKVTLAFVRKVRDKNLKDKMLIAQLSTENSEEYYKLAASHVTRAEIDRQFDPTIISGLAGSAFGFLSVERISGNEIPLDETPIVAPTPVVEEPKPKIKVVKPSEMAGKTATKPQNTVKLPKKSA